MHDPIAAAITAESQADIAGDIAIARDRYRDHLAVQEIFGTSPRCIECPHYTRYDGGRGEQSIPDCGVLTNELDPNNCPELWARKELVA